MLNPTSQNTKAWLHRIGSLIGMVGVLFVCVKLYEYKGQIAFQNFTASDYVVAVGLVLAYGAANTLLAIAWYNLLYALKTPVSMRWAIWTYAVSQLAKYIPGNVFQFAGRQAIGLAAGLPGWPLVKSVVWELALMSLCGAVLGILALPLLSVAVSGSMAIFFFCASASLLILAARLVGGSRTAAAAFCYFLFLSLAGLTFFGVLALARHGISGLVNSLPAFVGCYILAWLAGLLTPGAPAGLGVREAVLLMLLSGHIESAVVLLAVVLGRAVTIFGDLTFYTVARLTPPN